MCLYVIILDANAVFCFLFNCHSFLGSSFCQRESGTLHVQVVLVMNSDVGGQKQDIEEQNINPFLSFSLLLCPLLCFPFSEEYWPWNFNASCVFGGSAYCFTTFGFLLAVFENKITKKNIRLLVSCTSLCRIMETSRLCLFRALQVYCWCSSIFYSDNYSKPVTICI